MNLTNDEISERTQLARMLLARGIDAQDLELHPAPDLGVLGPPTPKLTIPFPEGLAPLPQSPNPNANTFDPLPPASVLVITWTTDEQDALADVLTPTFPRKLWLRYNRNFDSHFAPLIRPGAPSFVARRLGSWLLTQIGSQSVLCFKSELHLNQDGIHNGIAPGFATLPIRDLFEQLIAEVKPKVVLTVGTSGGVYAKHGLGDVVVTRAAKFRLRSEFKEAPFNRKTYQSDWQIPTAQLAAAGQLMQSFAQNLAEPPLYAPTVRHTGQPFTAPEYAPRIRRDGREGIPEFHPILTTDYFEFGTSTNHLEKEGMAVEMGDAVLGLVASELPHPPHWAVIRNLSDPQINGALDKDLQADYAVWYYAKFGYWTSVMSALTAWGIIAGLD